MIGKAKAGKYEDIVERVIPIRTEGLVNKQFSFQEEKKGKHHFEFEDEILKGNITTRLAPLPAALLQKPLRYLLQNHGDTESVIRTAQTALKAESLEKLGVLATGTLHKDQIQLENGERYAIPKLLENTLHILSEKQDYDGVIHYISPKEWHRLGIYEKHPRVNPELSIATFSLLESMKLKGYGKLIPQNFEKNLIAYLDSLGYEQPEFYLFYLAQDKTTKINKGLIHNLKKQYPKNIAIQALTFYLLSTSTDQEQLLTQAEQLHLQIQSALELGQYFETEILNLKVLQGYYLQGLLEAQKRFPTQKKFEQRSTKQLLSLMKSRNQEGLRGWGLSTNFHLIESFHAALTARTAKEGELSSCKLKI